MSSHENGAPGASGTGPALGYTLNQFWFIILVMLFSENNMNTSTYFVITISLIYAMKLIITFGIKIYRKLPIFLTIMSIIKSIMEHHVHVYTCLKLNSMLV